MKKIWIFLYGGLITFSLSSADFENVSTKFFNYQPGRSGKATWVDLNNDNFPDLIVKGRIYRNVNGQKFLPIKISGLNPTDSVLSADFNGDGNADLFCPASYSYWVGDGKFNFSRKKLPIKPNSISLGAAAADLNGDGLVDIYHTGYEIWNKNQSFPDYFLKNTNSGFEIAWQTAPAKTMRCHGGVTACDFNEDGLMEIYVGNYRLQPNFLWCDWRHNQPVDRARELGVAGTERTNVVFKNDLGVKYCSSGHTISAVWGDFDNDGLFDLFVGNFSHPPKYQDRVQFLKNGGSKRGWKFLNKSMIVQCRWQESYASSAAGDYDNDGRLDLLLTTVYKGECGILLHNDGDWKFHEATGSINATNTYQAAWADFDRDGRLDLFTGGILYRNITPRKNYVQVRLIGKAKNTSAIGALVKVKNASQIQVRQVEAGTGCGSQNDLVLHFGLGDNLESDLIPVQIVWSNGQKQDMNLLVNKLHVIVQK